MFYFFLARELGKTVEELLRTVSSRELTEWAAAYKIWSKVKDEDKVAEGEEGEDEKAEKKLHDFFGRAPS